MIDKLRELGNIFNRQPTKEPAKPDQEERYRIDTKLTNIYLGINSIDVALTELESSPFLTEPTIIKLRRAANKIEEFRNQLNGINIP